jgi:hypothetical protein
MNAIQQQLIELGPGKTARIAGRWVAGTYTGWLISDRDVTPACSVYAMSRFTSLPAAAEELSGGKLTDAA